MHASSALLAFSLLFTFFERFNERLVLIVRDNGKVVQEMLDPGGSSCGDTGAPTSNGNEPEEMRQDKDNGLSNICNIYSAVSSHQAVSPHIQDDIDHQNDMTNSVEKGVIPEKRRKIETDSNQQNSYLRKYYVGKDKNLPKQLKELFTPLKCNLCHCAMGSTITAKDHYEGKKHISNIKKWLLEHPEYSEKYCVIETSQPKIIDPDRLYCKYCDVMMSSEQQAQSHYTGKKHQNVINSGIMKNAYFNSKTGQWERFYSNEDVDGRFGIGLAFLNKDEKGKEVLSNQKFFCEFCQVACPSQITFSDHLAGAKHKKRIALLQNTEPSTVTKDNILEDVLKNEKKVPSPADLSIYRTPSGKYYCYSCNVTVNSPIQFLQHSESRKHKHKSSLPSANKIRK